MISYPFISKVSEDNPYGDRAITDVMERKINQACYSTGVFLQTHESNDLQVISDNGMTVKVKPGACCILGAIGIESSERFITLEPANGSLARTDRVVARFDLSDAIRSIELYVKEGTPSTTPVAPDVVQADNFYEIALADIKIEPGKSEITDIDILDQRQNKDVCGLVVPAFATDFDISDITSRYTQLLESALSGTAAGQLQQSIVLNQSDIKILKAEQLTSAEYADLAERLGIA